MSTIYLTIIINYVLLFEIKKKIHSKSDFGNKGSHMTTCMPFIEIYAIYLTSVILHKPLVKKTEIIYKCLSSLKSIYI